MIVQQTALVTNRYKPCALYNQLRSNGFFKLQLSSSIDVRQFKVGADPSQSRRCGLFVLRQGRPQATHLVVLAHNQVCVCIHVLKQLHRCMQCEQGNTSLLECSQCSTLVLMFLTGLPELPKLRNLSAAYVCIGTLSEFW